jgi:predicted Zn-ribbon and HTH transcriptional regulator
VNAQASSTGRVWGESPPDPLQADAEREREERRRKRAVWLTGVPFLASDGHGPLWAATAAGEEAEREAREVGRESAWLARGLEQRADHAHLHGDALAFYRELRAAGAEMPKGIAVCEDCRWVFRTARKRAAFKCPRCHKRSRLPERQPWHLAVVDEETFARVETFDRSMIRTRQLIRGEVWDQGGAPSGWTRRYLVACVGCDREFWTTRRDKRTCSAKCRVRVSRSRPTHQRGTVDRRPRRPRAT